MIADYLNQTASWQHVATLNGYNEATYNAAVSIKVRKESLHKLLTNPQGQVLTSNARVFTLSAVEANDLIDSCKVIQVDTIVDLDGAVSHYEAYVI